MDTLAYLLPTLSDKEKKFCNGQLDIASIFEHLSSKRFCVDVLYFKS